MDEQWLNPSFHFLFNKTDYLMAIISEHGIILQISHALATLYGWEHTNVEGKNFFNLIKKLKINPPYTYKELSSIKSNHDLPLREQVLQIKDLNYTLQWAIGLISMPQSEKLYMVWGTNITVRREAELMVKRTAANLESIVACMPGNVYWTDENSIYLGCNENVAKMLGLKSSSEVIGTNYKDHATLANWTQGQEDSFRQDDLEVISTGKPKLNVEEPPVTDAQGNTIYFLTSRVPRKDEHGNCKGVVGISIDITELHHTRFENQDLRDEVILANKEKRIFIYVLSARILNALSAFKTSYDIFYQMADKLPNNIVGLLPLIDNGTRKIINMLDHMTDFLDLQEDNIEKISIQRLAEGAIKESTDTLDKKPIVTILDFERSLPSQQLGDDDRIRRVLRNLIENAMNYTEQGMIRVDIRVEEKYIQECLLKIIIQDTGCGILPERLQGLFEVFERTTIANNSYKSGGFILSLTKKLIERLSGSIDVISQPGEGTTFIIEVPVSMPKDTDGEKTPLYPTIKVSPIILSDNKYFTDALQILIPFQSSKIFNSHVSTWEKDSSLTWCDDKIAIIDGTINVKTIRLFADYLSPIINKHSFFVLIIDKDDSIDYSSIFPNNWNTVLLNLPLTPFNIEENFIQEYYKWQEGQLSSLTKTFTHPKIKALLVEDNLISRKALMALAISQDLEVTAVPAVEAIMNTLDNHQWPHFDIILLDIELPGMSGVDFTRYLRKQPVYREIIIIAITAYTSPEDEIRYFEAGVDDVLQKPVHLKKLQEILYKYFSKKNGK